MSHLLHGCWSILIVIHSLWTIESSTAEKPCTAFSSNGDLVPAGSNFQVFCTYLGSCRAAKSMHIDKIQTHQVQHYNSTTIFLHVTDIRKETTYTCKCQGEPEPCGLDVEVGYLPSAPEIRDCIQKGEFGQVECTWMRGRGTKMNSLSVLWVKAMNSTAAPVPYPGVDSSSDPGLVSAIFSVSGSNQTDYSAWANSSNKLGSALSAPLNFTLDKIVQPQPPNVSRVECCLWACEIGVEGVQGNLLLEVRYRAAQEAKPWTSRSLTIARPLRNQSNMSLHNVSLQPYTLYEFQARVKLSPLKGLWSNWSKSRSILTNEEAPVKTLDVWYTTSTSPHNFITLHWKNLSNLEARGRITGYKVIVHNPLAGRTENVTSTTKMSVPSCLRCNITVYALNSKGSSPPTNVTISLRTARPPENVQRSHRNNHSFAISWSRPATAGAAVRGYLVEWYPKGRQVEGLRWKRLGPNEYHTVADDIKPFECFEGAVYVQYEGAIGRAPFEDISTFESAPSESPSEIQVKVNNDQVMVSWSEVPLEKQGGCVSKYTIYVKNVEIKSYDCAASIRSYTIMGLAPDQPYRLWMSAWTSSGEGPHGTPYSFFFVTHQKKWYIVIVSVCLTIVTLLCLLKQCVHHFLIPDIVPDPANSKWAKECAKQMGELTLQLYVSESSVSEEDEPDTVEVQELPEESLGTENPAQPTEISGAAEEASRLPPPQLSRVTEPSTTDYFKNPYLQSFSQESGSSNQTQDSQGTDIDYISTHLLVSGQEDEDKEECPGAMVFIPCMPLDTLGPFEGKLTLDAVRIDCSGF